MKWTFENTGDTFSLNIGPFIDSREILLDDITEAVYMVKVLQTDEDVDAKATLTLGAGLTKVAGATEFDAKITCQFSITDFEEGKLDASKRFYYTGLGIKTSGMSKFLEIQLRDDRLLVIPDFIHD
tara:strand:- start:24973 stop:25350 length:378 start_codon:yes stop_codon:yes gene_type:complete